MNIDDELKTIREEFFKKLTYRDQWNQVKYLKKAWPESVADYIDVVVRRLLKEQRAEIVSELEAILSFSKGQGWRGEEAFQMIEKDISKLITKLEQGEEK